MLAISLREAVERGDLLAAQRLVEEDGPPDPDLMRVAALRGNVGMIDVLMRKGRSADPELLQLAFAAKQLRVVDALVQRGLPLEPSLMRTASAMGWLRGVKFLHRRGVPLTVETVVAPGLASGSAAILVYALENGLDISAVEIKAFELVSDPRTAPLVLTMAERGFGVRAVVVADLAAAVGSGDEQAARAALGAIDPASAAAYLQWRHASAADDDTRELVGRLLAGLSLGGTWIRAATVGDDGLVERLCRADPGFVEGDGIGMLRLAAANGQPAVVSALLQAGVPLDGKAADAIVLAAANGWLRCVEILVEAGADPAFDTWAAGRAAFRERHRDILAFFDERGLPPRVLDTLAPIVATTSGSQAVIALYEDRAGPMGAAAATDLAEALRSREPSRIKLLLSQHTTNFAAPQLLALAAELGERSTVEKLAGLCSDLAETGMAALVAAAGGGHGDLVDLLLARGVRADGHADSALVVAAENGHSSIVRQLLRAGVSIHCVGGRPLAMTRLNGHLLAHDLLTAAGGDAFAEHRAVLDAMETHVGNAGPFWAPSEGARRRTGAIQEGLRRLGIERFKRIKIDGVSAWGLRGEADMDAAGKALAARLVMFDPDIAGTKGRQLVPAETRIFPARSTNVIARGLAMRSWRRDVAGAWRQAELCDRLKLGLRLAESRIGAPVEVWLGDRLISADLARSIVEANKVAEALPARTRAIRPFVLLMGGGYGRLAHVLVEHLGYRIVIADAPIHLCIAQHYLRTVLTGRSIATFRPITAFDRDAAGEFDTAEVAFVTPHQLEHLPDRQFDLAVVADGAGMLGEKQSDVVRRQLDRLAAGRVLDLASGGEPAAPSAAVPCDGDDADLPRSPSPADIRVQPTVALLLANYNHARYLHTSLEGYLSQTRAFDEILIVDDGSTDDTAAVVEEFQARDSRIRFIPLGWRRGQHQAIQRAIYETRCDYIVWAASDDLLLPTFVEKNLQALASMPEAGLAFSRLCTWVDGTSKVDEYAGSNHGVAFELGRAPRQLPRVELLRTLRKHYVWISGNTVVARRAALLGQGGFEQGLRWHADWFGFYVIALRQGAIGIPQTLAMMRERPDTYSASGTKRKPEQMRVLGEIIHMIGAPKYFDLREIFRTAPSMLSLYGTSILHVLATKPRHLAITRSLVAWHRPAIERWARSKVGALRGSTLMPASVRRLLGYEASQETVQDLWKRFGEGRHADVVAAIDAAFADGARGGVLHYLRGLSLLELRVRPDDARRDFDRSLRLGMDRGWVLTHRGRLRLERDDPGGRDDLVEAISLGGTPSDSAREILRTADVARMWVAFSDGKKPAALEMAQTMLRHGRTEPELHYVSGLCLHDDPARAAEALASYTTAMDMGFDRAWPLYHRGRLRLRMGDRGGRDDLATALALGGAAADAAQELLHSADVEHMWAAFFRGEKPAALEMAQAMLREGRTEPELHYVRGLCLHDDSARAEEALASYTTALDMGFDRAWTLFNRGRLRLETGDDRGWEDLVAARDRGGDAGREAAAFIHARKAN